MIFLIKRHLKYIFRPMWHLFLKLRSNIRHRNYSYDDISDHPDLVKKISGRIGRQNSNLTFAIIIFFDDENVSLLSDAVKSVEKQLYRYSKLLLVYCGRDLSSVDIGIMNSGYDVQSIYSVFSIQEFTEELIICLSASVLLTMDALYYISLIALRGKADCVYSDNDFINCKGQHINPCFKPDFSPHTLINVNYIGSMIAFRPDRIHVLKDVCVVDSTDELMYDIIRSVSTGTVVHVPKILYHERIVPGRKRPVKKMPVQYDAVPDAAVHSGGKKPLVSIIIPFRDKPEFLKRCVSSIYELSTYRNFEIIAVSNNSVLSKTFMLLESFKNEYPGFSWFEYNGYFNFSAINNYAVTKSEGEQLLFLNNDMRVISPGWMESLLEYSVRPEVGAVGALLLYPDMTVQHGGIIVGIGNTAGHAHRFIKSGNPGYCGRLRCPHNLSAVTAACMMVKKNQFEQTGGFDSDNLAVAFNDVDFCLRLREKGLWNVFTPDCRLIHYESKSRGADDDPESRARFEKESEYVKNRYTRIFEKGDPFYNPNLTLRGEDFAVCPLTHEAFDKLLYRKDI